MLTNYATISKRVNRLTELLGMEERGEIDQLPKKERKTVRTEINKLQKYLGGVREMGGKPDAMLIIDLRKEHIAFTEAKKLGIPVVALVDTNCDPTGVDYPIPGNDDAIRAVRLICRIAADACEAGARAVDMAEEDFTGDGDKGGDIDKGLNRDANRVFEEDSEEEEETEE